MQVVGNYILNIEIGGTQVTVAPQMIRELTITQDIERLLPTFKMVLKDGTKILSDVLPYDNSSNSIRIEITRSADSTDINTFEFAVKRRNTASPDDVYSVEGVLSVPAALTQYYNRAFSGNIKQNLEQIAQGELEVSPEIGASLNYEKTILQPNWTNATFLRYLRNNIQGRGGEAGYFTFVKVVDGEQILVVKSLDELLSTPVGYKFLIGSQPYQDFFPVSHYRVFDNSQLFADIAGQFEAYSYFNWDTGQYVERRVLITECPALPEFFLVDSDNENDSFLYTCTGRSNSFTDDFQGRVQNDFFRRVNSNVSLWVSTWGIEKISPGDIVQVVFSEALERNDLASYQHSGVWMVKRVVHIVGASFISNLELVRCGVDTDIATSLLETVNRKVQ